MGIAAVSEVGGDDRAVIAVLEGSVLELVGSRSPTKHRPLLDHSESGYPTVDTLHVRSIGADVRHGLDMFHKISGRVLAVTAHFVEDVVSVEKQQRADDQSSADQPRQFDAEFEDHEDTDCRHHAEPCRAAEGEVKTGEENSGDKDVENVVLQFIARQEDKADGKGQHECQGRAVGSMVVVEGRHDVMSVVFVETAQCVLVSGDYHDDGQSEGIAVEVTRGIFQVILKELHEKPVTGGDEPNLRGEELDRDDGSGAGDTGEEHPAEVDENGDGKWGALGTSG